MTPRGYCLTAASYLLLSLPAHPQTVTLDSLHERKRVLLIFGEGNDRLAQEQVKIAASHAQGFAERDMLLVSGGEGSFAVPAAALSAEEGLAARKRFGVAPGRFMALLLGKDGGEKLRSEKPVSWRVLQAVIDAMPMRQQELRERAQAPGSGTEPLAAPARR